MDTSAPIRAQRRNHRHVAWCSTAAPEVRVKTLARVDDAVDRGRGPPDRRTRPGRTSPRYGYQHLSALRDISTSAPAHLTLERTRGICPPSAVAMMWSPRFAAWTAFVSGFEFSFGQSAPVRGICWQNEIHTSGSQCSLLSPYVSESATHGRRQRSAGAQSAEVSQSGDHPPKDAPSQRIFSSAGEVGTPRTRCGS